MKKKLAMVLSAAMLLGTCITTYAASDSGYAEQHIIMLSLS